jgi:protein-S-isoprenylcysteine O-methyltransferase Ste14
MLRFPLGLGVWAALIFLPAGTLRYWQGWTLIAVWSLTALLGVVYLYAHDPQLLERRLQAGEKLRAQRRIMRWLFVIWPLAMTAPGLDRRLGWSQKLLMPVPLWLTVLSLALLVASLCWVFWTMKVSSFAARTIRVEPKQLVISSGPYRLVRHPMYLGIVVMELCMAPALGSFVALPIFALLVPLIVFRLINEETFLRQQLPDYAEYCLRTRFRLVPFIW